MDILERHGVAIVSQGRNAHLILQFSLSILAFIKPVRVHSRYDSIWHASRASKTMITRFETSLVTQLRITLATDVQSKLLSSYSTYISANKD